MPKDAIDPRHTFYEETTQMTEICIGKIKKIVKVALCKIKKDAFNRLMLRQ